MTTVLLDTDQAIDFLRGKSRAIIPLIQNNLAFMSILSVYELYAGMRQGEEQATQDFIQACQIETVTMDIAKNAGIFRYKCERQGITLSIVDCIIAETAKNKNHVVATNNKKHYPGTNFWL